MLHPQGSLLVLSVLSTTALCGHPAFESKLKHVPKWKAPIPQVDQAGYAIVSNDTALNHLDSRGEPSLERRWLAPKPDVGPGRTRLWPDRTISYCWADSNSMNQLAEKLNIAMQDWQTAGLPSDFKYKEVASPGNCESDPQRANFLVISYNDQGKLATTVGVPSLDANQPDFKGPTMTLDTRDNIGMLNNVANFAHELGHSWGLYHEHQNRYFWDPQKFYTGTGVSKSGVFGDNFDCTALRDYEDALARVRAGDTPSDEDSLCIFQGVAAKYQFSAADWLPVLSMTNMPSGIGAGAGKDKVDQRSIMLYPSGAGGKGSATPPSNGGAAVDNRQPVLRYNDGTSMGLVLTPSLGDVAGLEQLYGDSNAPVGQQVLPNQGKSSKYGKFKQIFKKSKGDAC